MYPFDFSSLIADSSLVCRIEPVVLTFKRPSGTSRGILTEKKSWILQLSNSSGQTGQGECSVIPGLSPDFEDENDYIKQLEQVSAQIHLFLQHPERLAKFPSILMGLEAAALEMIQGKNCYFNNSFTRGERRIPINGLIWMGDPVFMKDQMDEKIAQGFSCIKMKIGAIDLENELELLRFLRSNFSADEMTLRVDANGAFTPENVRPVLKALADLDIHSIEQPIRQGQWQQMKELCSENMLPIALDEELIGISERSEKIACLDTIRPPYIILKPSLHGGFSGSKEWIDLAEERNIAWWMTSALESNIGLLSIAQFAGEFENTLPQGLGTGGLYTWNFDSDLTIERGELYTKPSFQISF